MGAFSPSLLLIAFLFQFYKWCNFIILVLNVFRYDNGFTNSVSAYRNRFSVWQMISAEFNVAAHTVFSLMLVPVAGRLQQTFFSGTLNCFLRPCFYTTFFDLGKESAIVFLTPRLWRMKIYNQVHLLISDQQHWIFLLT